MRVARRGHDASHHVVAEVGVGEQLQTLTDVEIDAIRVWGIDIHFSQ